MVSFAPCASAAAACEYRQSDLDRFLAGATIAHHGEEETPDDRETAQPSPDVAIPERSDARVKFSEALTAVVDSAMTLDRSELAGALRGLAGAAESLADDLDSCAGATSPHE